MEKHAAHSTCSLKESFKAAPKKKKKKDLAPAALIDIPHL